MTTQLRSEIEKARDVADEIDNMIAGLYVRLGELIPKLQTKKLYNFAGALISTREDFIIQRLISMGDLTKTRFAHIAAELENMSR